MYLIFLIAGLLSLLTGMIVLQVAWRHTIPGQSGHHHRVSRPKLWIRHKKLREWLTPSGIRLHLIGYVILIFGLGMFVAAMWVRG